MRQIEIIQRLNEARAGFSIDALHWDRAHPEMPTLYASFGNGPALPGLPEQELDR